MTAATIKKQLFEQLALIAKCISSPARVEILDYLAQAERSVDELSKLTDLSLANTSQHLQLLKQNGIVKVRKLGKSRLYKLAGDDVVLLMSSLRNTAEVHLAEVERLMLNMAPEVVVGQTISSQELALTFNDKNLIIVDVRPKKEFLEGHIVGAVNVEPNEVEAKALGFPQDKKVVTYCRGPYCVYSYQLMQALKRQGIEALKLEDGFPEWKAAGLPFAQV